jgi:hypothetical protein
VPHTQALHSAHARAHHSVKWLLALLLRNLWTRDCIGVLSLPSILPCEIKNREVLFRLNSSNINWQHWLKTPKISYCNRFNQRVARQQHCKQGRTSNNRWGCVFYVVCVTPNAGNRPMNSQSDTWHVFSVRFAPCKYRGAVFSVCGRCREDIWEYGNRNWLDLTWVPKFQRKSSVARWWIRRLSVWRYMCWSISILGVCNLVETFIVPVL